MKILVTGTTGYIGKRLVPPLLIQEGHNVVCVVRDKLRAEDWYKEEPLITVVEADFLQEETLHTIPKDIDIAYYLIHSMSNSSTNFKSLEEQCAINFKKYIEKTTTKQVLYLSGITNDPKLSMHLSSRNW